MKKNLLRLLKKTGVLISISIIIGGLILVFVAPALILPRFNSWRSLADANKQEEQKLKNIMENIALLSRLDRSSQADYKDLIEKLVPADQDKLRVVAILNDISKKAGMKLTSMKVITKKPAVTQQTQPSPGTAPAPSPGTSTPPVEGQAAPATGTTTTSGSTTPQVTTSNPYSINMVMAGDFPRALKFIGFINSVRRAIGVTELRINTKDESGLDITLDFTLPLGEQVSDAKPEERLELSSGEIELLNDLLTKLTFDASPANDSLGRPDPFRKI